jgi:DNA-binding transcriptional LysR family regulator
MNPFHFPNNGSISFSDLEAFREVARGLQAGERGMRQTAERRGLTPSAVSQAVQRLERGLGGTQLLARKKGRGLTTLTPVGEALAADLETVAEFLAGITIGYAQTEVSRGA